MAILGRVLMLVACVPLLLPTGFCICKAGDTGCTQSHVEAARAVTPTPSHKAEGCFHHHATPDNSPAELPGEQPPQPAPAPHNDHSPGCPAASPGVERLQWSEPTPGATVALLPATFVVVALAPTVVSRPTAPPGTPRPVSLPLYLSHCSLVI